MGDIKSIDYLSQLPPELLGDIFDQAQPAGKAAIGPISKHLLPFHQRALFKEVVLNSYEQLDSFCFAARSNVELMQYVTKLSIDFEPNYKLLDGDPEALPSSVEVEDLLVPSSEEVKSLFNYLDSVHSLKIRGSSRLSSLVLTPEITTSSLPKLVDLKLTSAFSDFDDPFHPSFYTNLVNYTTLEDFSLFVLRRDENIRLSKKPLPEIDSSKTSIVSVTLSGPLSLSAVSVKNLLTSFGYLAMVTLVDFSSSSQLYDLLDGIDWPECLGFLSLSRPPYKGPSPSGSIREALSKFPSLDFLSLGGSCPSLSPEFYSTLRTLPLKQLVFDIEADVDLQQLTQLITGSKKHRSLETICFDNVQEKMGTLIEEMDGEPYTGMYGEEWGPYPDWELPVWTSTFNLAGLKKFLKVAGKEGMEVEGSAIEAIEVDQEFTGELDFLSGYGEDYFED